MQDYNYFYQKLTSMVPLIDQELAAPFQHIDALVLHNTKRVLAAFQKQRVSDFHFHSSTGYGYDDFGREKLDAVWAEVFGAEKALVRPHFVSGTHAIATALFGVLRPGDELVSVTGTPYDTLTKVIGSDVTPVPGSLRDYGVHYQEVPMGQDGIDEAQLRHKVSKQTRMVLIQRSRGYSLRPPLSIDAIGHVCRLVKEINPNCVCLVDNCYGEFVEAMEPTACGADLAAGSLIKNPGGGLVPAGGYIAGRADLVDLAASRLTAPGLGSHVGASLSDNRLLFQGLFLAPHIVGQALKGALFVARLFEHLGFTTIPHSMAPRYDIIQAIIMGSAAGMTAFCQGLQRHSPVNAHVIPTAAPMPGYDDQVIMAGGTFVQGSSIELSADGPIRPPYAVYWQGALYYEHAVVAALGTAADLLAAGMGKIPTSWASQD